MKNKLFQYMLVSVVVFFFIFGIGCSSAEEKSSTKGSLPPEENIGGEIQEQEEVTVSETTNVFINDEELTFQQVAELEALYYITISPGEYWYDSVSGLQGRMGQPAAGYINPGHDFGSLSGDASDGNTGVFVNGRELPEIEVQYLERILQVQRQQGYYWLDAYGNLGVEGNPYPLANLYAVSSSGSSSGGSSDSYVWSSAVTGGGGGGQGDCSYVNIPGETGISEGFVSTC